MRATTSFPTIIVQLVSILLLVTILPQVVKGFTSTTHHHQSSCSIFKSSSQAVSLTSTNLLLHQQPIIRQKRNTVSLRMAQVPLIDNWSITFRGGVIGTVSNHPDPDIDDGDDIATSQLATKKAECKQGITVSTSSGSKYKLGLPKGGAKNNKNAKNKKSTAKSEPTPPSKPTGRFSFGSLSPPTTSTKIKVSGKTIGDGKYLLTGRPRKSTSGKSQIWTAYRSSDPLASSPTPIGRPLTVKISSNSESLSREDFNYNKVTSGLFRGQFVEKYDYFPVAGPDFKLQGALVIESGAMDLKEMLAKGGEVGLEGRGMRDAAVSAAQCIQAMHSSGLVWTDLKAENFVVVVGDGDEDGTDGGKGGVPGVKAIDLESAIQHKRNPIDFSPEACPPEFAKSFVAGDGEFFVLDYNYDLWSLGMMLFELSTGRSYFKGRTPAQITRLLMAEDFVADVSPIEDKLLRDLVEGCLDRRPKKRPNINQVLLHPYFITSGFGPFGF